MNASYSSPASWSFQAETTSAHRLQATTPCKTHSAGRLLRSRDIRQQRAEENQKRLRGDREQGYVANVTRRNAVSHAAVERYL